MRSVSMDDAWVGRRLMFAARQLAARYDGQRSLAGPAGPMVAAVAASVLREAGRSITLCETDPRLAFARSRGVLRLPVIAADEDLAAAFRLLARLCLGYLAHLPGSTAAQRRLALSALAHAARSSIQLRRVLVRGGRDPSVERLFGGVAVLAFARAASRAVVAAPALC